MYHHWRIDLFVILLYKALSCYLKRIFIWTSIFSSQLAHLFVIYFIFLILESLLFFTLRGLMLRLWLDDWMMVVYLYALLWLLEGLNEFASRCFEYFYAFDGGLIAFVLLVLLSVVGILSNFREIKAVIVIIRLNGCSLFKLTLKLQWNRTLFLDVLVVILLKMFSLGLGRFAIFGMIGVAGELKSFILQAIIVPIKLFYERVYFLCNMWLVF